MEPSWLTDEDAFFEKFYPEEKVKDYDPENIEHYMELMDEQKSKREML